MAGSALALKFTLSLLSVEGDLGRCLFFKVGLNKKKIKLLIEMRADSLPPGQRRKFPGEKGHRLVPYFCPMCGGLS